MDPLGPALLPGLRGLCAGQGVLGARLVGGLGCPDESLGMGFTSAKIDKILRYDGIGHNIYGNVIWDGFVLVNMVNVPFWGLVSQFHITKTALSVGDDIPNVFGWCETYDELIWAYLMGNSLVKWEMKYVCRENWGKIYDSYGNMLGIWSSYIIIMVIWWEIIGKMMGMLWYLYLIKYQPEYDWFP